MDVRDQLGPADNPLVALRALAGLAEAIEVAMDGAVKAARQSGASWQAIGEAAGITRQSAHDKWREPPTKPKSEEPGKQDKPKRPGTDGSSFRRRKAVAHFRGVTLRAGVEVSIQRQETAKGLT